MKQIIVNFWIILYVNLQPSQKLQLPNWATRIPNLLALINFLVAPGKWAAVSVKPWIMWPWEQKILTLKWDTHLYCTIPSECFFLDPHTFYFDKNTKYTKTPNPEKLTALLALQLSLFVCVGLAKRFDSKQYPRRSSEILWLFTASPKYPLYLDIIPTAAPAPQQKKKEALAK